MLVLSRKRGQSIMVGDNIEISVVEIQGDQVRIGITAPANISIHRKEIFVEIRQENQKAAEVKTDLLRNLQRFSMDKDKT